MSSSSFGSRFVITSFGESHGHAMGVVIDGCPSSVSWNQELIEENLQRRRPGQSLTVSARNESDHFEILSGVFEGKTLGTPIALIIRNQDARSQDYDQIKTSPRAGHADDVWKAKFGISDPRGGGRSSGRETVARVLAGSVAQMVLQQLYPKISVSAKVIYIADKSVQGPPYSDDINTWLKIARDNGESYGGIIQLSIQGAPMGLGQPVFHKLKSDLAKAMMSIGAINGVELGEGFAAGFAKGTDFHHKNDQSQYGGIRGGISTGETIQIKLSVKPTSSILDVAKQGRHDPFIGTRAVPVVEAMCFLVLVDHALWARSDRI
jgi:chorismate synthase